MSEKNCKKPKSTAYVDDVYGIIKAPEAQIWSETQQYINNLNNYFKQIIWGVWLLFFKIVF